MTHRRHKTICGLMLMVAAMPAFGGVVFQLPGNPSVNETGSGGSQGLPSHNDVTGVKLFGTATGTKDCHPGPDPSADELCSTETSINWFGEGTGFFTRDYTELDANFTWIYDRPTPFLHWSLSFQINILDDQGDAKQLSAVTGGNEAGQFMVQMKIENIPIAAQFLTWDVELSGVVGTLPESLFQRLAVNIPNSSIDINPVPAPEPGSMLLAIGSALAGVAGLIRKRRATRPASKPNTVCRKGC